MNKKTKNNSGFTLVELIVVMCLMGIIMGAVMNFISPTAKLYKTTNAYLSQEEAVTSIYNFLEDDLMYATAVYIVPSSEADVNTVAATLPQNYKNCIVLDNVSVRTTGTDAASAKGATGTIRKYGLNGTTNKFVDVTDPSAASMLTGNNLFRNSFSISDQSFMEDDKYVFGLTHSYSGSKSYAITFYMNVYAPLYSGDTHSYIFKNIEFESKKAIEFINLSTGYTTGDVQFAASDVNSPDDYIYIFYDRREKISADAKPAGYICYLKDPDSGEYVEKFSASATDGTDISSVIATEVEPSNTPEFTVGTTIYMSTGLYSLEKDADPSDDTKVFDLMNFTSGGRDPVELYAMYETDLTTNRPVVIKFYKDIAGEDSDFVEELNRFYGDSIAPAELPKIDASRFGSPSLLHDTYDKFVGEEYDQDWTHTMFEWAIVGTTNPANFNNITTSFSVYPSKYKLYRVTFRDAAGDPIEWQNSNGDMIISSEVRDGETIVEYPDPELYNPDPENKICSWDYDFSDPVTAPLRIYLKVEDKPATPTPPGGGGGTPTPPSGGSLTVNAGASLEWNREHIFFYSGIGLTPSNGSPVTGRFRITITFTNEVVLESSPSGVGYNGTLTVDSFSCTGNTLSFDVTATNYQNGVINGVTLKNPTLSDTVVANITITPL